ncbi:hypothetical protein R6Q59_031228 [Mikania micrantha]
MCSKSFIWTSVVDFFYLLLKLGLNLTFLLKQVRTAAVAELLLLIVLDCCPLATKGSNNHSKQQLTLESSPRPLMAMLSIVGV